MNFRDRYSGGSLADYNSPEQVEFRQKVAELKQGLPVWFERTSTTTDFFRKGHMWGFVERDAQGVVAYLFEPLDPDQHSKIAKPLSDTGAPLEVAQGLLSSRVEEYLISQGTN